MTVMLAYQTLIICPSTKLFLHIASGWIGLLSGNGQTHKYAICLLNIYFMVWMFYINDNLVFHSMLFHPLTVYHDFATTYIY